MPPTAEIGQNKIAAKQCLVAADKYIKDARFIDARKEIEKAKSLDPSNLYITAFIDRIDYFEKERKLEIGAAQKNAEAAKIAQQSKPNSGQQAPAKENASPKTVTPPPKPAAAPTPKPEPIQQAPPVSKPAPAPKPEHIQQAPPAPKPAAAPAPKPEPIQQTPPVPKPVPKSEPIQQVPPVPKPAAAPAPKPEPVQHEPPPISKPVVPPVPPGQNPSPVQPPPKSPTVETHKPAPASPPAPKSVQQNVPPLQSQEPIDNGVLNEQELPPSPNIKNQQTERGYSEAQLVEMKKQIELLSQALEQEKKAREELKKSQIQQSVIQFRRSMERAWINGAPDANVADDLRQLALSLGIPENVEKSIRREVKVEMYSRAVKEVVSKRQLLKSSSSTFEWLRKVYQLTLEEYLEYESKFLMDLVSNQYKGTLFLISSDETTKSEVTPKLKAMGYAVVSTPTPENALEKIEKLNPNVIVSETSFGSDSITGIRFLHILRNSAKFNFIPFIFLTSLEDLLLVESSELKPNEGYVKKPVNIDDLTAKINEKLSWFKEYVSNLS